jgi:hypothetical protein
MGESCSIHGGNEFINNFGQKPDERRRGRCNQLGTVRGVMWLTWVAESKGRQNEYFK